MFDNRAVHGEPIKCEVKWRREHINSFKGRAIVIIRNPYKAIISNWNHMKATSNTKIADASTFKTLAFEKFVFQQSLRWLEVIEDWITFGREVHFIFYENFVDNPIEETRKLVKYLKLPIDEDRLSCLSKATTGSFLRTGHQPKIPFTLDQHRIIRMMIRQADKIVKDHNNEGLPIEKYKEFKLNLC